MMIFLGLLLWPGIAVAVLLRRTKEEPQKLRLTLAPEGSEYERHALEMRLPLQQSFIAYLRFRAAV